MVTHHIIAESQVSEYNDLSYYHYVDTNKSLMAAAHQSALQVMAKQCIFMINSISSKI